MTFLFGRDHKKLPPEAFQLVIFKRDTKSFGVKFCSRNVLHDNICFGETLFNGVTSTFEGAGVKDPSAVPVTERVENKKRK